MPGRLSGAIEGTAFHCEKHVKVKGKQDISTVIGSEEYVTDC
jgi:hypothetical protein